MDADASSEAVPETPISHYHSRESSEEVPVRVINEPEKFVEESSDCKDVKSSNEEGEARNCNDDLADGGAIKYKELTDEDIMGLKFKSVDEAEQFYSKYSLAIGFGYQLGDVGYNKDGRIMRREFLCSKEGVRSPKWLVKKDRVRSPKRETREGCMAKIRVLYKKGPGVYVVRAFVSVHTHPLTSRIESPFLRSHREVKEADLARAQAMRRVSIRPSHAYKYMVDEAGGYENVGFLQKDLYNKLDERRRNTAFENDTQTALAYMNARKAQDLDFFCRFNADEENRLANLFWRDTHSLIDYNCFGDVLIFDATYKTNVYGKPLVLFVGCNNHRGSIIFGSALVVDETVESYIWVLETFLESMGNKQPLSVLTDGDEAMCRALATVIPDARHRLCAWHLARNAKSNLQKPDEIKAFSKCMNKFQTVEQFEDAWSEMVKTYKLEGNDWIRRMYQKKEMWAQAYFGSHFFAGMVSTQRVEGMNSSVKGFVGTGIKLFECIPRIDHAV